MFRKLIFTAMMLCLPMLALGQVTDNGKPVKVIEDDSLGVYNYWSSDTVYNLQGFCFVEDGEILIIEPGTVIKGNEGQGSNATALIVARGGKIYAEGTPQHAIVFTTIIDDVDNPNDIPLSDARGKWGGVIILGAARINEAGGFDNIEGLPVTARSEYGGNDDNDNSGVLKYVSIRHGGSEIGAANEINGLTMGGVGRGTVISHIEVFYNLDDGYEWFGGAVNADHLVAAFMGDDAFDYDEGWRGCVQFGLAIHEPNAGDRGGEHDGGDDALDGTPFATPLFSNMTYIGRGTSGNTARCFEIRDAAGSGYYNSIFTEFGSYGINVEQVDPGTEPIDSEDQLLAGNIKFFNNIWWGFGDGNTATAITDSDARVEAAIFGSGNDFIFDPVMASIDRGPNGLLNPVPTDLSGWTRGWIDPLDATDGYSPTDLTGYSGAVDVDWPPFEPVDYPGAFDPSASRATGLWICNWTALDNYGFLGIQCSFVDCDCITDDNKPVKVVESDSVGVGAGSFTYWSADTVYNLRGCVYVEPNDTLFIGPGTVVKGNEGQGSNATALIVRRGATIFAVGSPTCPVVFTTIIDDVDNPLDIPLSDARGKWGGVILLGAAKINEAGGVDNIEGLPVSDSSEYGGNDDEDNSGALKHVSIRHGGSEIGAANEINGLTMGGVGRGTKISHVEVFFNLDDGFEWFGGSVNADHLIAGMIGDDAFDFDEGWRGCVQFAFAIHEPDAGDRGGEHDGGDDALDGTPFATPLFSNATYIGRGIFDNGARCFQIRDAAGIGYYNSIFTQYGTYGINVEQVDPGTEPIDSEDQLLNDNIKFKNNVWWGFGNGNTATDITNGDAAVEAALFGSGDNIIGQPGMASISRQPDGQLNPRPTNLGGIGWTTWIDPQDPTDGYFPTDLPGYTGAIDVSWPPFDSVNYPGAFDPSVQISESWAAGWSALWCYGYLGDFADPLCCVLRGDVNRDGAINISDVTYLVNFQFKEGPAPVCDEEGDVNGDKAINISDVTYLVGFQFKEGPAPPPCAKSGFSATYSPTVDNNIKLAVDARQGKTVVSLSTPVDLHGLQVDLLGSRNAPAQSNTLDEKLEFFYHEKDGYARIGVLDLQGDVTIKAGTHVIGTLGGEFEPVSAVVSDLRHKSVIPAMTTSDGGNLPDAYSLDQNYPNPFNPTTEISFTLPQATDVDLSIYNILGQKVTTLASGRMEPGSHTLEWNGTDDVGQKVASTVYFYRLQTDSFSDTKKMLLLK